MTMSVLARSAQSVLIALALSGISPALAADKTETAGYVLPETDVWDMSSDHGDTYRIYVSRPDTEPPSGGFPVLYVLDGNAMFAAFAEARRIQSVYDDGKEDIVIVGVGYPNTEIYDGRRLGDFTPPIKTPAIAERYKDYPSGHRDAFRAFLTGQLKTEIESRYSVNADRQSLFGHSLGGLFALHMAYSHPDQFQTTIAASPSIWWDNQIILGEERQFSQSLNRNPDRVSTGRLLLMAGDEEALVTRTDAASMADRLQRLSGFGFRSAYALFEDENHITVPARAVTTTLRWAQQSP